MIQAYHQADLHEVLYGFADTLTENDFELYQRWMVDALCMHEAIILGAFMGSGKTACALLAAFRLLKLGKISKALVVAPRAVALDTWPSELLLWDFARKLSYSVVMGTEEERLVALKQPVDIYVTSRDNYRWLLETVGLPRWGFDLLIYDEISRLKGGKETTEPTRRYPKGRLSEFGVIMRTRHKFKYVWGLTGTPASNGLVDLWGPMYLLDRGRSLGVSKNKFLTRWFDVNRYSRKVIPHDFAEEEILTRVEKSMFCLREEDYLDLPPLVQRDRWVTLSPEHLRMYKRFRRTLVLQELGVEAANSAVLSNKLLQFANGSVYAEEDNDGEVEEDRKRPPVAKHVHDRKLDELDSIFSETGGRSVLIAYSYRFDLHAIKKRFPWVRVYGETSHDLRDWNEGNLRALVLHPASAAHGLNFQHGGNVAVWFGLNWSLELYQQFNARLHRRGQKADRVWLYRILARDTQDGFVAETLEARGVTQEVIIDRLRVSLEQVDSEVV